MLSLSGAPDRVVSWSDIYFSIRKSKTEQDLSHNFPSFHRICHFNYKLVFCS